MHVFQMACSAGIMLQTSFVSRPSAECECEGVTSRLRLSLVVIVPFRSGNEKQTDRKVLASCQNWTFNEPGTLISFYFKWKEVRILCSAFVVAQG